MPTYTAISFAPVQSFIEKSRKLRDLFGASGILSYLSSELINAAPDRNCEVISPGLIGVQLGTPNRILVKGDFSRNEVTQVLLTAWQKLLHQCREWVENALQEEFSTEEYQWAEHWTKWGQYHWEIFWGQGECIRQAMEDLDRRKLRRDWVGVNWTGESSSLSGTDAIAHPGLGAFNTTPGVRLTRGERDRQSRFYERLASVLESNPAELIGKFLAPNERLSIPELAKRLVTRPDIARQIGISELDRSFTEIHRNTRDGTGQWTGWFMGDGDRIGETLKTIAATETGDQDLKSFSDAMRQWGQQFVQQFPTNLGRVVYAGGDDFLGVLYGATPEQPIAPHQALHWLKQLNIQWQTLNQQTETLRQRANLPPITLSVGFVWASPDVPQREILQQGRKAQKRAKHLGRDRLALCVLFNSGRFVQWTCRWHDLEILEKYCDRDGKLYHQSPNWGHIFTDWAELKARHAILTNVSESFIDDNVALELFDIYFPGYKQHLIDHSAEILADHDSPKAMLEWIEGLIYTGWYLASSRPASPPLPVSSTQSSPLVPSY
jgi:CRISPR-associated protein Cmr2